MTSVSEDRVSELTGEEYQWLTDLIARLKGKTMLMDKEEFLEYLIPDLWFKRGCLNHAIGRECLGQYGDL